MFTSESSQPSGSYLSDLPTAYLEAYPFPAFVLAVRDNSRTRPRLISRDTDVTVTSYEDVSPMSLAGPSSPPLAPAEQQRRTPLQLTWANEKWYNLTEGRDLSDCLDSATEDRLSSWVEKGERGPTSVGWIGEESVFVLNMRLPGVTLNLVKATLSTHNSNHTFCVITSQRTPIPSTIRRGSMMSNLTPDYRTSPSNPPPMDRDTSYFDQRRPSSESTSGDLRGSFSSDIGPSVSEAGREDATTPSVTQTSAPTIASASRSSISADRRNRTKPLKPWKAQTESELSHQIIMQQAAECWALVDSVDWAKTSLGVRENWSEVVDPLLSVVFQSKTQDCLWLGDDLHVEGLTASNMNYSKIIPDPGHPYAFGRKGLEVWAVIKDYIVPFFESCRRGESIFKENDLLLFEKLPNGEFCERYHTWRYNPIFANTGAVLGIYNQAMEVTDTVLADRRLSTVRALSEHLIIARTSREFFDSVAMVIEANQKDAPFLAAYSVSTKGETPSSITLDVKLEASVGVPANHPSAPANLLVTLGVKPRSTFGPNLDHLSSPTLSAISALSSGSGGIHHISEVSSWPISKALQSRQCVIVDDCRNLIKGYPIRAWGLLPRSAIIIPICSENTMDAPGGVIIMGLNIRRPFDETYEAWVNVIRGHLTSSLAQVKAMEEEASRKADAERMEKAKAAWFRGAAADLRGPLTLILGPLDDCLNSNLSQNQRTALTMAKRNTERLMRLVNALMDFSRVEAGRLQGHFVPTDLGLFVGDLAGLFRPAVERMRLEYHIEIQPSDKVVFIDPTLYETVISNVIGNALKYTETGSITVRLTYGEYAEVSVIDTGVGIPADELSSVTQWYHRATSAIHAGTQGTGLGLALAKELLHLHGGELIIESQYGPECEGRHGSIFTARVPLTPKLAQAPFGAEGSSRFGIYGQQVATEAMRWNKPAGDPDSDETTSDSVSEGFYNSSSKGSDGIMFVKTDIILIVDDTADMREYMKHIFAPHCKVVEANNATTALEMAKTHRPNLIISDYMMGSTTGMDLLKAVRGNEELKITPFIMVSAVAGEEAKLEALTFGAEDYISKPYRPRDLIARAHLHLQLGKKRINLENLYKERESEIKVLSDYCPSGIMRGDMDGHVVYANDAWRRMAGMPDNANPEAWPEYAEPETFDWLWPMWSDWLNSNEPQFKTRWKWLTGRSVSAKFTRLDVVDPTLKPGILGCLTDVTHEEEKLAEAEKRRLEAEESKHQQELLIDTVSHELRTPVSAILQCSSLVKENLVSLNESLKLAESSGTGYKPTKDLLSDINEDIEALEIQERIAGDVLSLGRIQLDMLSLYDIEMNLCREARKVLSVFASEATMKGIELALEFGETLEIAKVSGIKTDPVRLGQVITNLVSNSIRFTANSDVRKITVRYEVSFLPPPDDTCALPGSIGLPEVIPAKEDTPLWLFVSVRDTGPGLGPKELAMLFKRFSQGNKMIHTRYGGSGLGLFICRKITELLGGRIEVKSQLGEGSVFRFFIKTRTVAPPVRPSLSVTALAAHDDLTGSRSDSGSASPITTTVGPTPQSSFSSNSSLIRDTGSPTPEGMAEVHILIVEDNIINQTVLKRQMVKAGLTCDVANNGLEALNLIREAERSAKRGGLKRRKVYDCVLMDLEMPVMDGLTAIREIRSSEQAGTLGKTMVIALTGNARQGQIDMALAAGMDDEINSILNTPSHPARRPLRGPPPASFSLPSAILGRRIARRFRESRLTLIVVIKPYVLSSLLTKIKMLANKRIAIETARVAGV